MSDHIIGVTHAELRDVNVPRRFEYDEQRFLVIGRDLFLQSICGEVCLRLQVTDPVYGTHKQSSTLTAIHKAVDQPVVL